MITRAEGFVLRLGKVAFHSRNIKMVNGFQGFPTSTVDSFNFVTNVTVTVFFGEIRG